MLTTQNDPRNMLFFMQATKKQTSQIHQTHYIAEWAERRGLKQSDIVAEMNVDKSTVSRWFKGHVPLEKHLIVLVDVLSLDGIPDLFRHPDEDWIFRMFQKRSKDELKRIVAMMRAAFPDLSKAANQD